MRVTPTSSRCSSRRRSAAGAPCACRRAWSPASGTASRPRSWSRSSQTASASAQRPRASTRWSAAAGSRAAAHSARGGGGGKKVRSALGEGMKVTAKLADMALYDIPNVRLPWVQVDIYSTYRDAEGAAQRRVISTMARREIADELAWEELEAEAVVHAFGGRFLLDDRGNALPIDADRGHPAGVPAPI